MLTVYLSMTMNSNQPSIVTFLKLKLRKKYVSRPKDNWMRVVN